MEADFTSVSGMDPIVAWHFTDPGCPWAYSSRPAIARLRSDTLWREARAGEDPRAVAPAASDLAA